jgi:two-component system sensor histidine kinase PrrB
VEVVVDAPEELSVLAHPELVEQIVFNLAENALRHGSATRLELAARGLDGGAAVLEVSDNGTGVPAAERDRLFDRFYRGSNEGEGFGLGLAIVREVVRALGGTIELDSSAEGGTVVQVTLSRVEARVA